MENETATATQNQTTDARPIRAARSWADEPAAVAAPEASATLLAEASTEAGKQTQTTETQTPPATETADKTTTTTETKPPVQTKAAPEKYEFKAPEGTAFDPGILEAFSGAAKEADLTQDAAQKILEKMAPALATRQADQVKAIHEEWRTASAADTEFGGAKLAENLGVARKAYDMFATPELRTLLDTTGMGNHPEVIRMMYRVGKAISEDKFVAGSAARSGATQNPATVLYDKTTKG